MKEFLNGQSKTITGAAFILAIASLLSRFLGIVRDRILAGAFGAGDTLDTYYAAFLVPDFIYNMLVLGALSAGFIPIIAEYFCVDDDNSCKENSWKFVNNILNLTLFFVLILSGIGFVFAPYIMPLIIPGFDAEKIAQVVVLARIMFLSPVFLSLSSIFGSLLQMHKRFLVYAMAPIMYNLGIICGALFLVPFWGAKGLAVGVAGGAFLHMSMQFLASKKIGFRYICFFDYKDKELRRILALMVPRVLSLAVLQFNLFFIAIVASTLEKGSLSVFNLANNLQYFPIGIFGISFAIAAFPTLSENVAKEDIQAFVKNFSDTLRKVLFFMIPVSVLIIVLNDQIVRVVLGSGKFTWQDTVMTSEVLRIFCLSLFAQGLSPLFSRAFYALKDTKTPFICAFIAFVINIVLGLVLSQKFGIFGLVLAFSVASVVNLMLLHISLSRKIGSLGDAHTLNFLIKVIFASFALAVMTQTGKHALTPFLNFQTFQGIFLHGAFSGFIGIITFMLVSDFLNIPEYKKIKIAITENLRSSIFPYVKRNMERGN